MNILVTGGAGFIGSNFLNYLVPKEQDHHFINYDNLTYAANPLNLDKVKDKRNYSFVLGDITNYYEVESVFEKYVPSLVIHFAAESHVDRSILGPAEFLRTNIQGTFNLLEACRKYWEDSQDKLFLQVSTDEVYGSLPETGYFPEETAYNPSNPYSASKASADHFVRAYGRTYGLPVIITNCSNNYGPYQFPEKLIPLMILNAYHGKALPVYGRGENVRDWIYVEDHCRALWTVARGGSVGETYNIGGKNEYKNLEVVREICRIMAEETGKTLDYYEGLVTFVKDRPGHDHRYALDTSKIERTLNWFPRESFKTGLKKTVRWYLKQMDWVESVQTGAYRQWIEKNYRDRG